MERVRNIAYITVATLGIGALVYLIFRYLLVILLPFLIAFGIALLMKRPARMISSRIRISERLIRTILALVTVIGALWAVGFGVWRLSVELWRFFSDSDSHAVIDGVLSGEALGGVFSSLGDSIGSAIYELLSSVLEALGRLISAWVGMVPRAVLFLLATVIATAYFSWDLELICKTLRRVTPRRISPLLSRLKKGAASVALRYLRSSALMMLITLAVMLIGLSLLRVPYALLLALVLSIVDVLPVLGVGTVLIPWSIYELVLGTTSMGVGLLALYAVNTVIRQFAEPKILGKNLGIHPTLTLIFVYVGYSLFGFLGILVGPICAVLLNFTLGKNDPADVAQSADTERDDT